MKLQTFFLTITLFAMSCTEVKSNKIATAGAAKQDSGNSAPEVPLGTVLFDETNTSSKYQGPPKSSSCETVDCAASENNFFQLCTDGGNKLVSTGCCGALCTGKIDVSKLIKTDLETAIDPATDGSPTGNPALLIGTWTLCQASNELNDFGIKASLSSLNVSSDKNMEMKTTFFIDSACGTAISQAAIDSFLKQYEKNAAAAEATIPADVKAQIQALPMGMINKITYKAAEAAGGASGTIDFVVDGETNYGSYKIQGSKLYLTNTCLASDIDPDSNDNCKLVGETAAHRATDFSAARIFTKK